MDLLLEFSEVVLLKGRSVDVLRALHLRAVSNGRRDLDDRGAVGYLRGTVNCDQDSGHRDRQRPSGPPRWRARCRQGRCCRPERAARATRTPHI